MDNLTGRHIDQDAIGELLRVIEARADSKDWSVDGNNHFTNYVVYDRADVVTAEHLEHAMAGVGEPIRGARYAAQPMLPDYLFDGDRMPDTIRSASQAFLNFSMNIAFADPDKMADRGLPMDPLLSIRAMLQEPGVVGFIACHEAIGVRDPSPMVKGLLEAGMDIDQISGSKECRVALCADLAGRVHELTHWRGEDPFGPVYDVQLCSPAAVGLRILADLAANEGNLPSTAEEFNRRYHAHGHGHD